MPLVKPVTRLKPGRLASAFLQVRRFYCYAGPVRLGIHTFTSGGLEAAARKAADAHTARPVLCAAAGDAESTIAAATSETLSENADGTVARRVNEQTGIDNRDALATASIGT